MRDFFIYYTISNIACLLIFNIMLAHDLFSVDRQEKQIQFDNTLVAFMLYFLGDSLWAALAAGVLPGKPFLVAAVNFFNFVLMGTITYFWLGYVEAVTQVPHRNRPLNRFAVSFPLLVSALVLAVLYVVAPHALVSKAPDARSFYNIFQIVLPDIYIVAILFYTWRKARHTEDAMERRKFQFLGLIPLLVVGGGLVQALFLPRIPIFCFCSTILMLIFYIQSMEALISIDPLTKLNNRGQLIRYIAQKSNAHTEGRATFVVMLDINDFKHINDSFGHAEGDRALVIIADSLRQVVGSHGSPGFLGRYGGDEFILILHLPDRQELETMLQEIRSAIETQCRANDAPYLFSIGAGYDELLAEPDTFQKCVQRADQALYRDKAMSKTRLRAV